MKQATAILADDEPALRAYLRERLQQYWPQLQICAEAENGIEALELLQQQQASFIFLDIRMPGLDGMQVARQYRGPTRIVFVTAFEQYAVEAFEQHAIDYLLKPYTDERLQDTIQRLQNSEPARPDMQALEEDLQHEPLQENGEPLKWVRASLGDELSLIHVDDVLLFHSADKYTSVFTREREYLIRTPLKELEQVLEGEQFWRVHRSTIINVHALQSARRTLDGRYLLSLQGFDEKVAVSRAYAHLFRHM